MRAEKAPWPKTLEELNEYITSLTDRQHDYGTCVYAMSLAAVAAFQHVASKLGVTGFQASCADLDILRRTRSMEGPFIILKAEDMCYPQYDLKENLARQWASGLIGLPTNVRRNLLSRITLAMPCGITGRAASL